MTPFYTFIVSSELCALFSFSLHAEHIAHTLIIPVNFLLSNDKNREKIVFDKLKLSLFILLNFRRILGVFFLKFNEKKYKKN